MPLISVITPLYNSERFIDETISSVRNQTFSDFEHIIVDDCSTDNSLAKVEKECLVDSRVKLIKLNENVGAAKARNIALEKAEGRFIAFLDSDDSWLPEKLEKQINFMCEHDLALSCTGYKIIDESGCQSGSLVVPPTIITHSDMLMSNRIGCLTAMYDTHKVGKLFMPDIRKRQDYGLWLKILKKVPHAGGMKEVLSLYRDRKNSISSNKISLLSYNWEIFRKHENMSSAKSFYFLMSNVLHSFFK